MLNSNEKTGGNRRGSLYKSDNSSPQKSRFSHLHIVNLFPEKDSQPDTVGWDDPIDIDDINSKVDFSIQKTVRKFMLSGIGNDIKQECENIITSLGGIVSTTQHFDPTATHLVSLAPSRNEKILSSMASGKYIIHSSYLFDSKQNGSFLDENAYEFGNPKFLPSIKVDVKPGTNIQSFYWWRLHIEEQKKKAFDEMRIVLVANNKDALVRLIEAGDGVVVNASPPFSHHIDATHCLIDFKKSSNLTDFLPLAKQGIPCLNVIFLSQYLNSMANIDPKDSIPPELLSYYNNNPDD